MSRSRAGHRAQVHSPRIAQEGLPAGLQSISGTRLDFMHTEGWDLETLGKHRKKSHWRCGGNEHGGSRELVSHIWTSGITGVANMSYLHTGSTVVTVEQKPFPADTCRSHHQCDSQVNLETKEII